MANVFSANASEVTLDGAKIEGLQSIAYRVVTEREDIRAVGTNERIDVSFGLLTVLGEVVVKSHSEALDKHLLARSSFLLQANLKKDKGIIDKGSRTIAFNQCFLESKRMQLDAGGTATTTYAFTATSVKEE